MCAGTTFAHIVANAVLAATALAMRRSEPHPGRPLLIKEGIFEFGYERGWDL